MRAAEHERVRAKPLDVLEIPFQDRFRARRVRLARLDDVDQLGASLLVHADHRVDLFDRVKIFLAPHRALG